MHRMITLVFPYYDAPEMFLHQQKVWASYPPEFLKQMEIIVVDDCSPHKPALDFVVLPKTFPFRLYRIEVNIPWNQTAARNLGVHEADDSWLFLTDIDHVIPVKSIVHLFQRMDKRNLKKGFYYTFDRVSAPNMLLYKTHPNSYFMRRSLYWKTGGYDEEKVFEGVYSSDGHFRKLLDKMSDGQVHLDGVELIRYPREVISDASVTEFERDKSGNSAAKERARYKRLRGIKPKVLSYPWKRLI